MLAGNDDEIAAFCSATYGVTFPLARKSDVNGPETNVVFKHAKAELGVDQIDWNFAKFLFDRQGNPVKYFPARTTSAVRPCLLPSASLHCCLKS